MTRRMMIVAGVALALLGAGCLGTLPPSHAAETVARAPAVLLDLPVSESRSNWLLRQEPGWQSAHRLTFGGGEDDRARTVVRTAIFSDEGSASDAFARLTPAYMHKLWHEQMADVPHPVAYPVALAGEEVRGTEYDLRLPPNHPDREKELIVQLIAVREGRVVLVVESIGIPREELGPVVAELTRAARSLSMTRE